MNKTEKQTDHRIALHTAIGFHKIAATFFKRLKSGSLSECVQILHDNTADAICATTNFYLAIELYIKSIQVGLGYDVLKQHNLLTLFESLPNELQAAITQRYDEIVASKQQGELRSFSLTINSPYDEIIEPEKIDASDKSLLCLLDRNAAGFISWRYYFETLEPEQVSRSLSVEFDHLNVLANILADYILMNDKIFEANSITKTLQKRGRPISKNSMIWKQSNRQSDS